MEVKVTGEYLLPGHFPKKTEEEHFERYSYASKNIEGKKVLDIACGVGYGCKMYSDAGAKEIVGIDILENNITYAKENYQTEKINFIKDSIYDIKYVENFDIITCFETIEHIEEDKLALNKLKLALKEDGELIISTPNRNITSPNIKSIEEKPENEYHIREYSLEEFKTFVESNGFEVKKIFGQRNRYFSKIKIFNKIINKLFNPDENGNSKLRKNIFTQARYYTLVLSKK